MSSKILFLIFFCSLLVGCPVTMKVSLTNDTDSTISVLYSTGFESKIEAGKVKEEHYKFDCIRIKNGDEVHEFLPITPPNNYVRQGVFSSSVDAVFTKDNRLKIYIKESPNVSLELKSGC